MRFLSDGSNQGDAPKYLTETQSAKLMQRPYIPFFVFAVLFLLTIPFSFDIATSVVPGWHTTVLPPHTIASIVIAIVLLLVTVAYWKLGKRLGRISLSVFIAHVLLTIPTVIFIKLPFLFLNFESTDPEVLIRQVNLEINIILVAYCSFIAGQVLFACYFIKSNGRRAMGI